MENWAGLAINIAHDVDVMLDDQDQLVVKGDHFSRFLADEKAKMEFIVDATKVYKLKSKRRGRMHQDWVLRTLNLARNQSSQLRGG